jgi:hypothetical protein
MRHSLQIQPDLQIVPIEKIRLPPILTGLQWIWTEPALRAEILALLDARILAGKKATGRTGMDLWQILVLVVVRLGLDADWDRMEHSPITTCSFARCWAGPPRAQGRGGQRRPAGRGSAPANQRAGGRRGTRGVRKKKGGAPVAALEIKVDPTCWKQTSISPRI